MTSVECLNLSAPHSVSNSQPVTGQDRSPTQPKPPAPLRCLARRYQSLTVEVEQLRTSLDTLTLEANPALRIAKGVGADVASILLIAVGDNPQRLRSEAAFAALCGVSPIEASSGKPFDIGSTKAGTVKQTTPCGASRWSAFPATRQPRHTPSAGERKENQPRKSSVV